MKFLIPFLTLVFAFVDTTAVAKKPESFDRLYAQYRGSIRPILKQFCIGCHGAKDPQGELRLDRFKSLTDARRTPGVWQKVLFMLVNGEMPPKGKKQLSARKSKLFKGWIRRYLDAEAHARAGDPGRVILRRLSNAELNHTVRDLTGVDLRPADGFPTDSAAGEGFTNTGDSLVMSPALLDKYIAAAEKLAARVVLLPNGLRFSVSRHSRDWEQRVFEEIRGIYRLFADENGLLPVERYLKATLQIRERGGPQSASLDQLATRLQLSPRALRRIWKSLNVKPQPGRTVAHYPMDAIRTQWRRSTSQDFTGLIALTKQWQHKLWRIDPLTVGWHGQWQTERPLISQTTSLRLKLEKDSLEANVYLVVVPRDANVTGRIRWQNPRFEMPGKPPILLKTLLPKLPFIGRNKTDLVATIPSRTALMIPTAGIAGRTFHVDAVVPSRENLEPVHVRIVRATGNWQDRAFSRSAMIKGSPRHFANVLNGNPIVRFKKGDYVLLGRSDQLRLPTFSITAVVKYDKDNGGPVRSIYNNYDNPINWGKGTSLQLKSDGTIYFFTTAGTQDTYDQLFSSERLSPGFHIVSATYTGKSKKIYADGKLVASVKSKGLDYGNGTKVAIGALREFKQHLETDLAELIVFRGVKSKRRQDVELALSQKYGLSVIHPGKPAQPLQSTVARHKPSLWYSAERFQSAKTHVPSLAPRDELPLIGTATRRTFRDLQSQEQQFRAVFPLGLCFNKITPLNPGQITLRVHYREDKWLRRLMLNDAQRLRLDRAWKELEFIGKGALREHNSFDVFLGFTTQVSKAQTAEFEQYREPIRQRAEALKKVLLASQPHHVQAALSFAAKAWRRPLAAVEKDQLVAFYSSARKNKMPHEAAVRQVLVRIFMSPNFLYRIERPRAGLKAGPIDNWELATRLSYFLWASQPDKKLYAKAAAARLTTDELIRQTHRMIKDGRVRGLATEFACQWLGLHDFSTYKGKNEKLYPTFSKIRGDMYEEVVRFFIDLFQRDGSVLDIIDGDHTMVNPALAKHYGMKLSESAKQSSWRRVTRLTSRGRGGVLGMAAILAKQSGATRTSPVLRGNWIVETLLGEKLPDPPATVPQLPDAISRKGLTVRQLTERHVSHPSCARCHVRIDPFGFSLESFDAIGRQRTRDLVGKPIDTRAKLRDGTTFRGIQGLQSYLLKQRRDDFLRQFCKKLLGYSLGRSVQLSDRPLIDHMIGQLKKHNYRISSAVNAVVLSKQFRFHRGLEATRPKEVDR